MKVKRKIASLNFLLIGLSSLLFFSCSLHQVKNEAPSVNEITKGTKFRINLPENHTTGYMWQLNDNYNKAIVEELNAVWHGNEKGIDFNFKALKAGEATFTLVQRKYNDTLNVKSFIVKITD